MKKNPYSTLIKIMREQGAKYNPPSIQIGQVISPPPNIVIKIGDLQVDKDNILIADYLLPTYQRQISIPMTSGAGIMSSEIVGDHGTHTHTIYQLEISQGKIQTQDTLKSGDLVAVMPTEDRQTYIVLAKVVSLSG
ncbi:MAG: DUF2577 domain-containing protein [Thermovenabulum sp.]|uniref:DUF2577 domain-containing protein n=1 Tax=Thermovenabulum sp. TaxID=3100335 RepID=UPI003C7A4D9D